MTGNRCEKCGQDEGDAERARAEKAEADNQRWVDQVVHYRNLAITLGAIEEQMLDSYDRGLVRHFHDHGDDPEWRAASEHVEPDDELEKAEAERDAAHSVIRRLLDNRNRAVMDGSQRWFRLGGSPREDTYEPMSDAEAAAIRAATEGDR